MECSFSVDVVCLAVSQVDFASIPDISTWARGRASNWEEQVSRLLARGLKTFHLHCLILLQNPCLGELLLLLRQRIGIRSINSGASVGDLCSRAQTGKPGYNESQDSDGFFKVFAIAELSVGKVY